MKGREPVAHAAYAELILTLVDARSDPATKRFDHEIATAVADGRLDEQTARTLRWWQRESVRGVRDHLADVLPPLLDTLESSAARTATTMQVSEEMWRTLLTKSDTDADGGTERVTQTTHTNPSRPATLNLPIDLTDRRRRMVVAGLVAARDSETTSGSSREGRR